MDKGVYKYKDDYKKQCAYKNAIDCLYYGYGQKYWNSYDLQNEEKQEIWKTALENLESDF